MQNLNGAPVLVQTVVDVERRMEKTPELRMSFNWSTDEGKRSKRLDMVEKIIRKSLGRFGMPLPRPLENLFQIG